MVFITAILLCSGAVAQDFSRSEFSVRIGGGASGFQTQPTEGKDFRSWTGTAGLGYHFFFNPHWGVGTGADFAVYNGGISIDNYSRRQDAINKITGNPFDFLVKSSNYKEPQQVMMVNIPLMLQYQGAGKTAFYAAMGGKAGIPVSAKSRLKGNFSSGGFFPNLNVTYEDIPEYGFVTDHPFPENKTDITLKTAFMASVELGVKWRLGKSASLYTGIYVDYGLNNLLDKEPTTDTDLVIYQSDTPSQFAYNTAANLYVKQIAPVAGGITLRLAFGCKKISPVLPALSVEEPTPELTPPVQQKVDDSAERLAAEEARRKAEEEARRQAEAGRMAKEQEAARLAAEEETRRQVKEKAIHDIEQPVIDYLLFQTDVDAAQKKELDEKVALLQQYPDLKFYIYSHTCNVGTREANERVGLARAGNAKKYLISKGIDESRILGIASKQDAEPLVPNTNEKNRRINRRVQLIIKR